MLNYKGHDQTACFSIYKVRAGEIHIVQLQQRSHNTFGKFSVLCWVRFSLGAQGARGSDTPESTRSKQAEGPGSWFPSPVHFLGEQNDTKFLFPPKWNRQRKT